MENAKIYSAISAAMADVGVITKAKTNSQQHFQYRGIDDVMNALYPILVKHGLFITPEVLEHTREERQTKSGGNLVYSIIKMKYTMYAEDGSNVSAIVIGEGMDSGDKSSNKAMSIAMKYAMFQLFCIPTEEMVDPDATTPEPSQPKLICYRCKKEIKDMLNADGTVMKAAQYLADYTKQKYGQQMCCECASMFSKR